MATKIFAQKKAEELANALQTLGLSNALLRPAHQVFATIEKGKGIRAIRSIPQGSLIFDEEPLFSVSHCEDNLTAQNIGEIERLAEDDEEFKDLYCARPTKRSRQTSANIRRFELNNIEMINRQGRRGIFKDASRINHSCLPNAYFDYNEEWGRLTVYTIRDIDVGQEILVSYRSLDWHQT